MRFAPTSGSHRGHAVDVFEGRRFRVIYYLAMVATGLAIPFIDLACPTRIRLLDTDSSP